VGCDETIHLIYDGHMVGDGEETATVVSVAVALEVVEPGVGGGALGHLRGEEVGAVQMFVARKSEGDRVED